MTSTMQDVYPDEIGDEFDPDEFEDNMEVLEDFDDATLDELLYGSGRDRNAYGYSEDIDWDSVNFDGS